MEGVNISSEINISATLPNSSIAIARNDTLQGHVSTALGMYYTDIGFKAVIFILPVLLLLSCLGNSLSLMVLLKKQLRSSVSVILAALSCSDITFMITMSILLLPLSISGGTFDIRVETKCGMYFIAFFLSHLSAWLVVLITLQRVYMTFFPSHAKVKCTIRKTMIVIGILVACVALLNAYMLGGLQVAK